MDASVRSMVRVPRTNPKSKAGVFSRLFFLWLIDTIRSGNKNDFDEEDIPEAMPDHKSEVLTNGLQRKWEKEKEKAQKTKETPRFIRAIIRSFGLEFLFMSSLNLIKDLVAIVLSPLLLRLLLQYFTSSNAMTKSDAVLVALALCLTNCVTGLLNVHFMNSALQFAVRVRAACITMVYRKCLRLSQSALSGTSPGQIINLVSNDVARFELVSFMLMPMLSVPFISLMIVFLLYEVGGKVCFVGVGAVLIILIVQFFNAKSTANYRLKIARRTDERVRLMDEIVLGIQVIKLYAWEKPFQKFIDSVRKLELNILRKVSFLRAAFMVFVIFSPRVSLFATLLVMVLCNMDIDASSVFVLMVYFSHLATFMTGFATRGFAEISECMVSIRRIQEFLLRDEYQPVTDSVKRSGTESVLVEGEPVVMLTGVSAKWTITGDMNLTDLNLDIRAGQLVAIIGTVGCGKSSLLNLLLGELIKKEGKIQINGTISYAAQESWIFNSSVRQNILFREDYNPTRYKIVCKVCELEKDFEMLPRGDKTVVGEKGASLSGGQKARINLARAVYKKADIYLLDDPLSAVDTHVAKHLFYNCIEQFLGDKTRILVTHQVQHLSKVNHLIMMENGRILMQGTFKELRRSHYNFASVLGTPEQEKSQFQFLTVEPALQRNFQRSSTRSEKSVSMAGDEIIEYEEFEREREEEQIAHLPTLQVYQQYLSAGVSPLYCVVVAALFILTQILVCSYDYWIAYWLHREQDRQLDPLDPSLWPTTTYLAILGAVLAGIFVIGNLRGAAYYAGCVRCSRGIHSQMFQALIGTSLSFFHNNPSGRILNRFSRDIGATDELLAKAVMDMGQAFGQVIGGLAIAVSVNHWLAPPIVVLSGVLWVARRICLKASKNLKRVEGIVRSPVYSHINASLQGLVTIRAHSAEKLLQLELSRYLDLHTSVTHIFYNVMSSLSLAQEVVTNTYMSFCVFSFILFQSDLPGTNAALIITQSLTIMQYLQWGMKMSAEVANQMTCIERAVDYTHLEPEEQDRDNKPKPLPSWPQFGLIEMRNVFMRYDIAEPYILRNVNFTILPKEKIGIVGRTGAGKSSLIAALFRLTPVEGSVIIDAVDTSTIPLESLRSHISIIPQDPVLFSGSLRTNLDPFQKYTDAELYSILYEVNLSENTKDSEGLHLGSQVTEGGGNFSVGQRQLVCLARAILGNNKILVLDEATANVDPQTDALIQTTIRHTFAHCTVLTVAHRLNTIIDSDRVLVMDAGTVAEFDHPHVLLSNSEGLFFKLVQQTGPSMARELTDIARQNFKNSEALS